MNDFIITKTLVANHSRNCKKHYRLCFVRGEWLSITLSKHKSPHPLAWWLNTVWIHASKDWSRPYRIRFVMKGVSHEQLHATIRRLIGYDAAVKLDNLPRRLWEMYC